MTNNGLYEYDPSLASAIIGCISTLGYAVVMIYQYFRFKTWYLYFMILAILMYATGMVLRAYSIQHPAEILPAVISYLIIIIAPSLMAAACYQTFGRIVWFITPPSRRNFKSLGVPPRFIAPTFLALDALSFLIQFIGLLVIVGAAVRLENESATPKETNQASSDIKSGLQILTCGLVVQLLCFAIFAIVSVRFSFISRSWAASPDLGVSPQAWKRLSHVVNAAGILLTLRAIYRVIEFVTQANNLSSYTTRHEWPFWIFDFLPVILVFGFFISTRPSRCLPPSFIRFRLNKKAIAKAGNNGQPAPLQEMPAAYGSEYGCRK